MTTASGRRPIVATNHLLETHRQDLRVRDLDLTAWVLLHTPEVLGPNPPSDLDDTRLAAEGIDLLGRYLSEAPRPNSSSTSEAQRSE